MMDRLQCGFEVKFADSSVDGSFSGYGAVFSNLDSYGDVIQPGAFKDTLKTWKKTGRYPPMLLQHAMGMTTEDALPVGVWTSMEEDDVGLKVEGRLIAMDTDRAKYIYEGLKTRALDGLSIGYVPKEFVMGTKPKEPRRSLKTVDLMECSVVVFPANDKARVKGVKSAGDFNNSDWRDLEAALRDEGLSRADAVKAVSGFKAYLQRDAGEPDQALRDEAASGELRTLAERIRALAA
jgi:HK97 family phage prohead protease